MNSIFLNVYRYISLTSFLFTTFINVLLIVLTIWYINKKFGMYKYLIIIFSMLGISYDVTGFLISPMIHSFQSGFIYFTLTRSSYIPINIIRYVLVTSGSIFVSSTSMLAVMFIHRYFSVAKPEQLFYFQGKKLTFWLIYVLFFGIICFVVLTLLGDIDDFTRDYTNYDFMNYYGVIIDEIAAFSFIIYDTKYRWDGICFTIIITLVMFFQNYIIIFCGIKIHRKLNKQKFKYSSALYKLHRQLFRTLILQVTIPTLFIFLPVLLIIYAPFIGIKLSVTSTNIFCLFYLYPAIDSCIVMYVITEYKAAIKDLWNDIIYLMKC